MSTTDVNEPGAQATARQILARLILLTDGRELPEPIRWSAEAGRVKLELANRQAFDSWLKALGGRTAKVNTHPVGADKILTWATVRGWHRYWDVEVELREAASVHSPLDAETAAALEEVAAADSRTANDEVQA